MVLSPLFRRNQKLCFPMTVRCTALPSYHFHENFKNIKINFVVSLPGNPRNKTALRPGFSLMDWIRLTKSGKDLSGTGGQILEVTPRELSLHRTRKDAWMAINGKEAIVVILDQRS